MDDAGTAKGISVDVWRAFAADTDIAYELIRQDTPAQSIQSVIDGTVDVAIGPISITPSRLKIKEIEFTQPYFVSHIGLLVQSENPSIWKRLRPIFGWAVLSSIGLVLVCIFLVGNLMWIAERRHNPEQFPPQYHKGVANGMWFSLVTLTTVGYGDRAPLTGAGRIIAGVWMLITLMAVSSITAGLASAFTISLAQINQARFSKPGDLRRASIAVVKGTTSVSWGQYYRARIKEAKDLPEAIDHLDAGEVEGVIFDRPALRHHLKHQSDLTHRLARFILASESYGFVLPADSPLLRSLNVGLIRLQREGRVQDITDSWLTD